LLNQTTQIIYSESFFAV